MIEDDSIKLTTYEEKHFVKTIEWVNDLSIMMKINRVFPVTMVEHAEWFKKITFDKNQVIFAVETMGSKNYIGNCGLKDIDLRSRKSELWIYFGKDFIGNGNGKKAIKLLLKYGFEFLNLNRIYLYTLDYNQSAQKAFSACGFKVEGIFKQEVYINGCYHDTVRMAILRDEYERGLK